MFRVITPQRMQTMERAFMESTGTPGLLLMERAAQAVADKLAEMTQQGALFLCGPGNNGGDGYAAARLYAQKGRNAWVWALSDPGSLAGDARTNWLRCLEIGIPVTHIREEMPSYQPDGCGVLVDALFGTGLARPLDGLYADAVRFMNASPLPVLAVDMPSGTADLMAQADETITFHQMKTTHLLFPGRINAGHVTIADIGIPPDASPEDFTVLQPEDVARLLPPRPLDAHKGTTGHVLIAAGSTGMAGAAALCANAALRGGAGLVTTCCSPDIRNIIQTLAPCATCVDPSALPSVISGKAALAAGPGLGGSIAITPMLEAFLQADCPQVWDADALNWLPRPPRKLGGRFVLTPHPGEAARILKTDTAAITGNPIAAAEALHAQTGAVILLKGATTVIIGDGQRAMNIVGSPGMATGGSGDVLTGLIAALLAQGIAPFDAARLGALLHGIAGQAAAKARGIRSMTAADIIDSLHIN